MKSENQKINNQKMLRDAKLKCTIPRLAVIALLAEKHTPISVQAIHDALMKKDSIDLVTVYRTLASFEKAGLVKRVDLRKDTILYELANDHHHHLVCTNCGTTEDFVVCDVEDITKKVLNKSSKFSTIQQHSLELFGICKVCAKR